MFLVESMVKHQNSYTERSRKRINNVKLKYSLFRNLLCNMGKNIEEICNQKERIEKEIESMRLGKWYLNVLFSFFFCLKYSNLIV